MKDRRTRVLPLLGGGRPRRPPLAASFAVLVLLCCALFSIRLFSDASRPALSSTWPQRPTTNDAAPADHPNSRKLSGEPSSLQIQDAVSFPDQLIIFLKPTSPLPNSDLHCLYHPPSPTSNLLRLPITSSSTSNRPLVRCPAAPRGFSISLSPSLPSTSPHQWDHLSYAALFDPADNTTIVFAKGLNLRPARLSNPSLYNCLFGWDFSKPKYLLSSPAISVGQEIVRCETPLSVIARRSSLDPIMVSVKFNGRRRSIPLPSVARSEPLTPPTISRKKNTMCVCTMVRNQARFLKEWITYHSRIGVERMFIYDNNSDDGIEEVIGSMEHNVTLHEWPWVKTQEAGFAHCALRARDSCEWVGFIDVDEFLYLPTNVTLHEVLNNYSSNPLIGELRTSCHSFGPSGRRKVPSEGVMVGYTCRMSAPERHKSIVRPDSLNPSLINVVHHFHLKDGMLYVNMERGVMVINHYKYQVWEVFKEKFYRRVATYVADWQDEENAGSKDRAPGLGTKAVEPSDWSSRFCEVNDTGLRDWVMRVLVSTDTGRLPW